jgi:hypothetical protein
MFAGRPLGNLIATLPHPLQESFRVSFYSCECNLQGEPMSLRLLGSLLLLTVFAAFRLPMASAGRQEGEPPSNEALWEYNVVRFDPSRCANEEVFTATLNTMGLKGWELVSYERLTPVFPNAEGNILMRPAATGAGRDVTPQLADSFQGTITMRVARPEIPYCRVLFKRPKPVKS